MGEQSGAIFLEIAELIACMCPMVNCYRRTRYAEILYLTLTGLIPPPQLLVAASLEPGQVLMPAAWQWPPS